MSGSGGASVRGYLLQTIICLLDALQGDGGWESLTLEPHLESEKIDIIWYSPISQEAKVAQVKSSQNQINKSQAEQWAKELSSSIEAASYKLILIGPCSQGVVSLGKVGDVEIPLPKALDVTGLIEQAAHRLDRYLDNKRMPRVTANGRELLVSALVTKLETYSTSGRAVSRNEFDQLLQEWISVAATELRDEGFVYVPLDSYKYAEHMLTAFADWQQRYTPLQAEYREFDLYVTSTSSLNAQNVPVLEVPGLAPVVVLLGESGAGKTTALWRMVVDLSNQLIQSEGGRLPVLVSLRNWSQDYPLRHQNQNQFSCIGANHDAVEEELIGGNCLVLVDGLNELPHGAGQEDAARRDLQNFLDRYPENEYVFTCRTLHYNPDFLAPKPGHSPPCFEIQRLDRGQVREYVRRYFKDDASGADDLLAQLQLEDDHKWGMHTSFVHLARIPLHLQMMILEYQRTGRIPANKARMLQDFASQMVRRDRVRQVARVDIDAKQRILGYLAYRSIGAGYYLSLPEDLAKAIVADDTRTLWDEGMIPTDLSVSAVWEEILSNNFLVVNRSDSARQSVPIVEWLHQVLFDYFLACEIIRTLVVPGTEDASEMRRKLDVGVWDQPCQIALGLIDSMQGARFLEILGRTLPRLAQCSFEGQCEEDAISLARVMVRKYTDDEWDEETLARLCLVLPYALLVDSLIDGFRGSEEHKRQSIAKIVSCIAREHYGSSGAERAQDILESWVANRNEVVRFHSAIGLWAREPGRAVSVLRKLHASGSSEVRAMVNDLADEWGL
jgi:hypothetical protein